MEGTRLRILQILQKNSQDSVHGLAKAIGLAPATVRRHLDILQRDRLVDFTEVRQRTGRPAYAFYLTDAGQEALPKGYDVLLGLVIQELDILTAEDTNGRDGSQILQLMFQRLSDKAWERRKDELDGKDLQGRFVTLMKLLEEEDFSPEAEVVNGALQIRLLNCPFRSVALENKAVCSYDANLISNVLNVGLEQQACIHDRDPVCTYVAHLDPSEAQALSPLLSHSP